MSLHDAAPAVAFIDEPSIARAGDFAAHAAEPSFHRRAECTVTFRPKLADGPRRATLRYLWHGAAHAPTVLVLGGISAGRDVVTTPDAAGWWDALVGPARAIDLTRCRVLSIEWLTRDDLRDVAAVCSEDQADAIAALLDALGIDRLDAFVGASYGAMVGLAFATRHARRTARLIAISGAHRAHPLSTALRAIQRRIVRDGIARGDVGPALALARQVAMTTYRGADEFAERFDAAPALHDGRFRFAVEDYLDAVGEKFGARFDAQRFLCLSESIDLHRLEPVPLAVDTTLIGIESDRLVPLDDMRALAAASGSRTVLHEIDSPFGHDAFLKEAGPIGALVATALCRTKD